MKECKADNCTRENFAKGFCKTHYHQQWAGKELTPPRIYNQFVDGMKICPACLTEKPLADYYMRPTGYPCSRCKECMKAMAAKNRVRAAEKAHQGANQKNVADDATQNEGDAQ